MSYADKTAAAQAAIAADRFVYSPNLHYRIGMRIGALLIAIGALNTIF